MLQNFLIQIRKKSKIYFSKNIVILEHLMKKSRDEKTLKENSLYGFIKFIVTSVKSLEQKIFVSFQGYESDTHEPELKRVHEDNSNTKSK